MFPEPPFACVSRARKALCSGRLQSAGRQASSTSQSTRPAKGAQPELSIHCHFDDCCELQHFASRNPQHRSVALLLQGCTAHHPDATPLAVAATRATARRRRDTRKTKDERRRAAAALHRRH